MVKLLIVACLVGVLCSQTVEATPTHELAPTTSSNAQFLHRLRGDVSGARLGEQPENKSAPPAPKNSAAQPAPANNAAAPPAPENNAAAPPASENNAAVPSAAETAKTDIAAEELALKSEPEQITMPKVITDKQVEATQAAKVAGERTQKAALANAHAKKLSSEASELASKHRRPSRVLRRRPPRSRSRRRRCKQRLGATSR